MNFTEARAVNVVLRHLLGIHTATQDEIEAAARLLADNAHKRLGAGLSGASVNLSRRSEGGDCGGFRQRT